MGKKMLVVVDYQVDFVSGALGFTGAEELDDGIAQLVKEYRENGNWVVVTMDTHHQNYLETREGRLLPIPHCIEGTPGWQLYGKTRTELENTECIQLCKGAFGVDPWQLGNLPQDVDAITVVGLVTNLCVLNNVCCLQAAYPEVSIVVDAGLCGGADKELNRKALDVMKGMLITVVQDPG